MNRRNRKIYFPFLIFTFRQKSLSLAQEANPDSQTVHLADNGNGRSRPAGQKHPGLTDASRGFCGINATHLFHSPLDACLGARQGSSRRSASVRSLYFFLSAWKSSSVSQALSSLQNLSLSSFLVNFSIVSDAFATKTTPSLFYMIHLEYVSRETYSFLIFLIYFRFF